MLIRGSFPLQQAGTFAIPVFEPSMRFHGTVRSLGKLKGFYGEGSMGRAVAHVPRSTPQGFLGVIH